MSDEMETTTTTTLLVTNPAADHLEMLDNVSAAAETMLLQFGSQMSAEDRAQRTKLIDEARRICDVYLRGDW